MVLSAILLVLYSFFFSISSHAATYWVAKTGSDNNSCAQAQQGSTPRLSINAGVACLSAGDTLYVKTGTYLEWLNNSIPAGTSWSAPVTVAAYPANSVTIQAPAGAEDVIVIQGISKKYIVISGFILDAAGIGSDGFKVANGGPGDGAHHIRLQDSEIKNGRHNGILVANECDDNEFLNLNVHDNGSGAPSPSYGYGFYINGSRNLVERGSVHHNAGNGVVIYNGYTWASNNNIVSKIRSFNNGVLSAAFQRGNGIYLATGSGNVAYNNLVYNNFDGIWVGSDSKTYNNTICKNTSVGVQAAANTVRAIIKNNIIYQNGTAIDNQGSQTVMTSNLTSDPKFLNLAALDFRLLAGSSAIDTGSLLSEVPDDVDGTPRPLGSATDIGAHEYSSSGGSGSGGSGPTNLRITQ